MVRLLAILIVLWSAPGAGLSAEERAGPVVVELFTSQGCSFCPPADALLEELSAREELITLALHVDYWDYLGWADPFAAPDHTTRQRAYGAALGVRSLFTPQMVIDGSESVIGSRRDAVSAALERAMARPAQVVLRMRRAGAMLEVEAAPLTGAPQGRVLLFTVASPRRVDISRGENAGRAPMSRRVAHLHAPLGALAQGGGAWRIKAPEDVVEAVAVAQARDGGPVLGAARLPLAQTPKIAGAAPETTKQ